MLRHYRTRLERLEERCLLALSPLPADLSLASIHGSAQETFSQCPGTEVAGDGQGNFALVWSADGEDGSGKGVFSRQFDAAGNPRGDAYRVNTTTSHAQAFATVAMDVDGDFVITWSSLFQDGSGYGVYAQRYNALGKPAGDEFRVNTYTLGNQNLSAVAMDEDGDFVITWTSQNQEDAETGGSGTGIFAQRYAADGTRLGDEFQINTTTSGNQRYSSVAMTGDGFIVTWTSQDQDGNSGGIVARRFDADGIPRGEEFLVNTTTLGNQQLSAVAADETGASVIAWQSYDTSDRTWNVMARAYAPSGEALTGELTLDEGRYPSIAMGPGGDFVVGWESYDRRRITPPSVVVQHYDPFGTESGDPISLYSTAGYSQEAPAVATAADRVMLLWTSEQPGESTISAQLCAVTPPEKVNYPPILTPMADQSAEPEMLFRLTMSASDYNVGDTLTYTLIEGPDGAWLDPMSGDFQWTPTASDEGVWHTVTIGVADNGSPPLEDRTTFRVGVGDMNQPPELAPLPDVTLFSGAALHIALDGYDVENESISYAVQSSNSLLETAVLKDNRSLALDMGSLGEMRLELFEQRAPDTTARIIELAESGFYDGLTFHRIIESFMIQGGDPAGNGTGGTGIKFDDEYHPDLQHTSRGILSMANSGHDTNDSQFFITSGPTRHLDFHHSVFGLLTDGEDVRAAIAAVPVDEGNSPQQVVVIESMEVVVDEENGVLVLSAPEGTHGEADVTITATDSHGLVTRRTFHVTIRPDSGDASDAKPYVLNHEPVETTADTPVTFHIDACDIEGDAIVYSAELVPADPTITLEVSSTAGEVTVTPSGGFVGVRGILLTASGQGVDKPDTQLVPLLVTPAAPTSVALLPDSDTGKDDSDALTSLNNTEGRSLTFRVDGLLPAAQVTLYAGEHEIGQAVAVEDYVEIATNASFRLADDTHHITATQTMPGVPLNVGNQNSAVNLVSERSTVTQLTIDTKAPVFLSTPPDFAPTDVEYIYNVETDEESTGDVTYELTTFPPGMRIYVTSGRIIWEPTGNDRGTHTVVVEATDAAGNVAEHSFDVVVDNNFQFVPRGDSVVAEDSPLTMTIATVNGAEPVALKLDEALPEGANFDAETGAFAWKPSEEQGPETYTLTFTAIDANDATTSQTIVVTVTEDNVAPVIASIDNQTIEEGETLSIMIEASDTDLPAQTLMYSLESAPPGATIDSNNGRFTWTPTEDRDANEYTASVRVTDDAGGSTTTTFQVVVSDVNHAPTLEPLEDRQVDEGETLAFVVSANDPDLPSDTLTFRLDNPPSGATIDARSGLFSWTPDETQGPGDHAITVCVTDGRSPEVAVTFTVSVIEVERIPILQPVVLQRAFEHKTFRIDILADDPDLPEDYLTFKLDPGSPLGAMIDPMTGQFVWTPGEVDGGTTHTVNVRVTDSTNRSDTMRFSIVVDEENASPVLLPIANQHAFEGEVFSLVAEASDTDLPTNTLAYRLANGAPDGMTIDAATGTISWIPAEEYGGTTSDVTIVVTDGTGVDAMHDQVTFTVVVAERNAPPVIRPVAKQTVSHGQTLTVVFSAEDPDLPTNTLRWGLAGSHPDGAVIDPTTGRFTWTLSESLGTGDYSFTVYVFDDGSPVATSQVVLPVEVVDSAPQFPIPDASRPTVGKRLAPYYLGDFAGLTTATPSASSKRVASAIDLLMAEFLGADSLLLGTPREAI